MLSDLKYNLQPQVRKQHSTTGAPRAERWTAGDKACTCSFDLAVCTRRRARGTVAKLPWAGAAKAAESNRPLGYSLMCASNLPITEHSSFCEKMNTISHMFFYIFCRSAKGSGKKTNRKEARTYHWKGQEFSRVPAELLPAPLA